MHFRSISSCAPRVIFDTCTFGLVVIQNIQEALEPGKDTYTYEEVCDLIAEYIARYVMYDATTHMQTSIVSVHEECLRL